MTKTAIQLFGWSLFAVGGVFGGATVDADEAESSDKVRYFRETIEPILKTHCLKCHSHGANEMGGGLTLDSRSGWANGGDRGPAIVPGKPGQSLVIKAVRRGDDDLKMPPDEKLPEHDVQLLVRWIRDGAIDPRARSTSGDAGSKTTDWWSLRPLELPAVPPLSTTGDRNRVNVIDAFVRRRLSLSGLSPAPQADRRTLIRRLHFDLHGLPPTPEAVDEFVNDGDPLAYEKLVDQLLNSPRYGERWARHWLDTVHFADSHGCEHDVFRPNAWRYRDYVISSFNRDTAWGRFVREQLAADWYYPNDTHLTPALGFIAAGPLELSRAGTAPVTFDYLDRDDIVTQTMAAFASTTANCARCHNHKFDPITQEDYYSLQAVFAGAGKGDIEYDTDPEVAAERRRWSSLLTAAKATDQSVLLAPENQPIVAEWLQKHAIAPATWEPLSLKKFESSGGATLEQLDDSSILASGIRPDKDTYTISASAPLKRLASLRLDVLADDRLPMKGPGRCDNGNLHLNEFEAFLIDAAGIEPQRLKIRLGTADWNQAGWTISHALDGNEGTAWGIYPKVGQSHYAVFELEQPVELSPTSRIVVHIRQLHGGGHLIGRLKLYATETSAAAATVLPDNVRVALKTLDAERTVEQQAAIAAYASQLRAERELANLPAPAAVYGWSRLFSHGKKNASPLPPKVVHVLARGDIDQPGEVIGPGSLSAVKGLSARFELSDPANEASRRAALAEWLTAQDNPLAWRSAVNRVWGYHFGRGLCDTPNDFGRMGGQPSHPELLDWLAIWFRDEADGSLKDLHRLILTSATWRQQATVQSEAVSANPAAIDSENRLLWKMPVRPMDAESFRDAVLQVSGRIDLEMGGPGIQHFTQSPGQQTTPKLDYDAFDWGHPTAARRSIQRVVWRGIADPFMESLDFPDLGLLSPKRGYSVSALQALAVYNNDFVLHHSRVLADRLTKEQATLDGQISRACRLIFLRDATEAELGLLSAYAERHGLAATCRVLLNSNEFIFVE